MLFVFKMKIVLFFIIDILFSLKEFSLNASETLHSVEDIPKNQILNSSDPFVDLDSFSIASPLPNISLHRLNRTKSLANNFEENQKDSSRSLSLPSIKFNIKDHIMLTPQSTITDSNNDNHLMPMIVNVEENVEINNQNVKSKNILSLVILIYQKF